jgi:hypothetical protein
VGHLNSTLIPGISPAVNGIEMDWRDCERTGALQPDWIWILLRSLIAHLPHYGILMTSPPRQKIADAATFPPEPVHDHPIFRISLFVAKWSKGCLPQLFCASKRRVRI